MSIVQWSQRKVTAAREQFKNPEPDILAAAVTAGVVSRSVYFGGMAVILAAAGIWYGALLCVLFLCFDLWTGMHTLRAIVAAVRGALGRAFMDGFATPVTPDMFLDDDAFAA